MNRRAFLLALGTALAAFLAVWSLGPLRLARNAKRRYLELFGPGDAEVVAAIHRQFAHLRLEPGAAEQFVRDYRTSAGLYPLTVPLKHDAGVRFLLSTNFIQQQADPAMPVSYTVFYHPYRAVCYNPFMMVARSETGVVV